MLSRGLTWQPQTTPGEANGALRTRDQCFKRDTELQRENQLKRVGGKLLPTSSKVLGNV